MNKLVTLFLIGVSCGLGACGGGGGSSTPSSTPLPPPTYTVGGTVSGLASSLVLQNGAETLSVTSNGTFTFATSMHAGDAYNVSVKIQPTNPTQVCTIGNASGSITTANATVGVTCVTVPLTLASSTPLNGATNVARDGSISFTFSTTLKTPIANSAVSLTDSSGSRSIATSVSGNTLTITPAQKLAKLTDFTVSVSTAVQGSGGELLANAISLGFKTSDGSWSAPTLIETDNAGDALYPQVASDANGKAVAVWYQFNGTRSDIVANRFDPATGWATATLVEQNDFGSARDPQFAFDNNGNGMVVWSQSTGGTSDPWASRYYGAGTFGPPYRLIANTGFDTWLPQVAFDITGNALAIWGQLQMKASWYSTASGWNGIAQPIGDASKGNWAPHVCFDDQGRALAVWEAIISTSPLATEAWSNYYVPGLGWGAPHPIDSTIAASDRDLAPQVVCETNGEATVIWNRSDATHNNVLASRFTPTIGFDKAKPIDVSGQIAMFPSLAIDAQGNVIAVWMQYDNSRFRIWTNRYTKTTGWGTAVTIDSNASDAGAAQYPHVAITANGNAAVVWQHIIGGASKIAAARYVVGAGWSAPVVLDPNDTATSLEPRVTLDSFDNAIAVWTKAGTTTYNIWSSRFE